MPHAEIENLVTCAEMECVQPGTEIIVIGYSTAEGFEFLGLEFCSDCARRRREREEVASLS